MKKKIFLILLLVGVAFNFNKAYAVTGSYEHNNFKFTVKKIHFDIYKSKLDDEKNFAGYEGEALATVDVPDEKTIKLEFVDDDEEAEDELVHTKTTLANLTLDMEKADVLALVKGKVTTPDADNHYYVRMVVDYSIDKVASPYEYYYKLSYEDKNNSLVFNTETGESSLSYTKINSIEETISSVFGAFEYKLIGDVEDVNYSKTYEEGMPLYLDYLLNGLTFSTLDELKQQIIVPEGGQVEVDNPDDYIIAHEKYLQTFAFFGYSNVEAYAQALADDWIGVIQGALQNGFNTEVVNPEEVAVPDTALHLNNYIYIIGAIIILSGLTVVGLVFAKK